MSDAGKMNNQEFDNMLSSCLSKAVNDEVEKKRKDPEYREKSKSFMDNVIKAVHEQKKDK